MQQGQRNRALKESFGQVYDINFELSWQCFGPKERAAAKKAASVMLVNLIVRGELTDKVCKNAAGLIIG
jgi:hypothetical protein